MRTKLRLWGLVGAALVAFGAATSISGDARACGGTFCDSGPTTTPVDQKGENILFVMEDHFTEAHIQIQYTGDAHHFAWVLPMPVVPTIKVGSQQLFTNLLAGSVPVYRLTTKGQGCGSGFGCGASDSGEADFGGGSGGGSAGSGGGPTVVLQETVGAFDVSVLQGGTAHEVEQWLADNGYGSTADTPALLADYVKQSYVFVAVKLEAGAGVDQIQPIVLRYASTMPCVPIRLTRVAATDNMGIRAFFLGKNRVYPENYALVDVNPAQIDWVNGAFNYDAVVSHAIDEAPNHLGFVVEYAGSSEVVSTKGLFEPSWAALDFSTELPQDTVRDLERVGLASCVFGEPCTFASPLLLPLLRQYLPAPAGVPEGLWYRTLGQRADQIDPDAWDGAAFQKDFTTRIVEPGQHAEEVLGEFPTLTRLFTELSPAEMTLDPTFVERPDLDEPDVGRVHAAIETFACDANSDVGLGILGKVVLPSGAWPNFKDMPFASRIRKVPASGPPLIIADNTAEIIGVIADSNDSHGGVAGSGCATGRGAGAPIAAVLGGALGLLLFRRRRRPRARRART